MVQRREGKRDGLDGASGLGWRSRQTRGYGHECYMTASRPGQLDVGWTGIAESSRAANGERSQRYRIDIGFTVTAH